MLLLVVTSLEQLSDAGVGKCSCNAMISSIMLWTPVQEEALLISWTHRHRAGPPRAHGPRSEILSRAGALLCVLALLVQLALAVEHTWEVSLEATAASAALASQQPATGPGDTRAILQGGKSPTARLSRSSAVFGMPAPVPGKNRYGAAWSWDFPSPNQLCVSAGFHLP